VKIALTIEKAVLVVVVTQDENEENEEEEHRDEMLINGPDRFTLCLPLLFLFLPFLQLLLLFLY
jgi:hypothetical protein